MLQPDLKTERLGGVDVPAAQQLRQMHESSFILHAGQGQLREVSAEKVLLPPERETSPQAIDLVKAPDGTLYSTHAHIICKSSDGGRSWSAHDKADRFGPFAVLPDGIFIGLSSQGQDPAQVICCRSVDEGRSFETISRFANPPGHSGGASWITLLRDSTLLAAIGHQDHVFEERAEGLVLVSGGGFVNTYRSDDGGESWSDGAPMHDWFSEGGVTSTDSGKLLAAMRYQRPTLPGDAPDLCEANGSSNSGWPFKHVCLVESDDQGGSWRDPRLLVSRFGQTRGHPVALEGGTVVVVHDTRYGPGHPGTRAMVSRDDGSTWKDEVYYLDTTNFTGSYAASVALEDVILTVAGSSTGKSWQEVANNTDFYAIRWQLES